MDINVYDLADWLGVDPDLLLWVMAPFLWVVMFGSGLLISVVFWATISGLVQFFGSERKSSGPPHNWMS